MPKFDDMNETDVRDVIVRPLLKRLGYEYGTENTIRMVQTFRYAKAFLGRKNASKDLSLVGHYQFALVGMPLMVKAAMKAQFSAFPAHPQALGGGLFEVQLLLR